MKECQKTCKFKKVKVGEGAYKAVFDNPREHVFVVTHFDGCVIKNSTAADFVVTKPAIGDLIVELKGRDVDHGVDQVMATAAYLNDNNLRTTKKMAGLIVCRQYPRESAKTIRLQVAFAKTYKSPLHVKTGNREYNFESLFSR